jgi:hypothetical protein
VRYIETLPSVAPVGVREETSFVALPYN